MNKKYRLLKDLPGVEAGAVSHDFIDEVYVFGTSDDHWGFGPEQIEKFPDWFEEVKDEKPEKIKKGTVMVCESDKGFKVVYTGKGEDFGQFSGVVIKKGNYELFIRNEYSRTWNLSSFKPAQ